MDHLPLSDIPMLVSTINFLLRDDQPLTKKGRFAATFSVEHRRIELLTF